MEELKTALTILENAIEMNNRHGDIYCMNITDVQIIKDIILNLIDE